MNAPSSGVQAADKLTYMANQIARNLALDAAPARAVAEHIRAFWSPEMKAALLAHGNEGLEPIAAEALAQLGAKRDAG